MGRTLLFILLSGFALIVLRVLFRGLIGDFIVAVMQRLLPISQEQALQAYQMLIRNNLTLIILIVFLAIVIFGFLAIISRATKSFDEISRGLESLTATPEETIELPPELETMENQLNDCRNYLLLKQRDALFAEQRKNDLVVYLAHDIRTPLTSVIGYLSLLDEAPDMPAEQRARYVHITLEKAIRLESLINEFFEITRYNFQQIRLEKEPVDLYYMLVQMADEFYPLLTPKNNTISLDAEETITVYADPDKLARVFNNILKNAVSYSTPGTVILVTARVQEGGVFVTFQNEGRTIPREKLNSIFEKFYRLDEARTSNNGGAGLGLAIAKEIVTLHGGTISAQSDEGRTTFTVRLPSS